MTPAAIQYMQEITSGAIPSNRWVRAAVSRHQGDLGRAASDPEFPYRYNAERGVHYCQGFSFLRLWEGKAAGSRFLLQPWMEFIVCSLQGWENKDTGFRRYREGYISVARKNAKSTLLGGMAVVEMFANPEPGGQIISAATKADQAAIIHRIATFMALKSPAYRTRLRTLRGVISEDEYTQRFIPISSDAKSQDGANPSLALIDELHAHPNSDVYDVVTSGDGARDQPLTLNITTAGTDPFCFCRTDIEEYARQVLAGVIEDDRFFAIIYSLEENDKGEVTDDPLDSSCWIKSNPGLGVTVTIEGMKAKATKAAASPQRLSSFCTKNLNIWQNSSSAWLSFDDWRGCRGDFEPDDLVGRPAYAGIDLSTILDLTSIGTVFPPTDDDPLWYVLCQHFCPEEQIETRARRDRVPYPTWVEDGWIIATPGNTIDHDYVGRYLEQINQMFDIKENCFDPNLGAVLMRQVAEDGYPVVEVRQGAMTLAPAAQMLEDCVASKTIRHIGDPVLGWAIANVACEETRTGAKLPSKKRSRERIDPVAAIITGMARAIARAGVREIENPYNKRGVLSI